jgi:periplasmic protein TonB
MFEDSLIDSSGRIKTQSKYYTVVGILLNTAVLATMILVPLVYPEALPRQAMSTLLIAPPPPLQKPEPQPAQSREPKVKAVSEIFENSLVAPRIIPTHPRMIASDEALLSPAITGMGEGSGDGIKAMTTILNNSAARPVIGQAARKTTVSSGVMQGYVLSRVTPIYPAIARAAHISGTVVMQATISKTGSIVNLHVLSGPPMLQQSAMEAVRNWRYKPYLLNGEPVEVETEINVIFNLGG